MNRVGGFELYVEVLAKRFGNVLGFINVVEKFNNAINPVVRSVLVNHPCLWDFLPQHAKGDLFFDLIEGAALNACHGCFFCRVHILMEEFYLLEAAARIPIEIDLAY